MTSFVVRRSRLRLAALALLLLGASTAYTQEDGLGGRARAMVHDGGLPGIDRGLRDQDPPIEPYGRGTRGLARAERADGDDPRGGYVRGSVIVKFKNGAGATCGQFGDERRGRDRARASVVCELRSAGHPDRRGSRSRLPPSCARGPTWNTRRRGIATTRCCGPTIRCTASSGTSRSSTWSAPGTFSRRPAATSRWRCSTPASRSGPSTIRYNSSFNWRLTANSPVFPALGIVDVPFAVAPELGDAKFVSPRDFIWDDDLPFDLDGHGTHVSGTIGQLTNNNVGRGRHGLQRQDHAGQSDRRGVGLRVRQPRTAAPTTRWRAASATRPTTAPR